MDNLSKKDLVELVIRLCRDHNITAYEISKHTGLNTSGIQRILSGEVSKPREETLNSILNYLSEKLPGSALSEEPANKKFDVGQFATDLFEHEEEILKNPLVRLWLDDRINKEVIRRLEEILKHNGL